MWWPNTGFFEMEQECLSRNAVEFGEASFSEAPKALDAVHVRASAIRVLFRVVNSLMFVAIEDKAVVALPLVGIDGGLLAHQLPHDGQKFLF